MTQNLLFNIGEMFKGLWEQMGIANGVWQNYVMLLISFVLFYLAIVKKFEPLLLLPIAFGMFIVNVPGAYDIVWGTYPEDITTAETFIEARGILPVGYYFADGKLLFENVWATQEGFLAAGGVLPEGASIVEGVVHFAHTYDAVQNRGLLWYLFYGVDKVIYPPLIFLGIGAMTDFGPLISNPKSMFIGAAAQLGIFVALFLAICLGFDLAAACSIAIIARTDLRRFTLRSGCLNIPAKICFPR